MIFHLLRRSLFAVAGAVLIAGTVMACSRGAAEPTASAIRPGEWEVTISLVSLHMPGRSEAELAAMRAQLTDPVVERQCLNRPPPTVGAVGPVEGCTYTLVQDAGDQVHREANCRAGNGSPRSAVIRGRASADAYDYTISISSGRAAEVVTRETGRRLGDCAT